jgi:hypothetical protein
MEPNPTTPDPTLLPRAIHYQVVHTLRGALPPPVTDSPEDAARRDIDAIAHVASLRPVDPEEAHIAAQYVAASACALDCQRAAHENADNPDRYLQCMAQSTRMMREAKGWRALLARTQADRQIRQADPVARDFAIQTEQRALRQLAEALAQTPPELTPKSPDAPPPDPIAEAEHYAQHHRKRAALIRKLRRLPRHINVGYIPPAVVHALINGTTPTLQALDAKPNRATATAA